MQTTDESRFYAFGNYYLSSIQQGIQALHVVTEMFTKYEYDSTEYKQLHNWANKHKTVVLLNGGNAKALKDMYALFNEWVQEGMTFPFAKFNEDMQSLDGALTSTGIVLPAYIYNGAKALRISENADHVLMTMSKQYLSYELQLMQLLNQFDLAH